MYVSGFPAAVWEAKSGNSRVVNLLERQWVSYLLTMEFGSSAVIWRQCLPDLLYNTLSVAESLLFCAQNHQVVECTVQYYYNTMTGVLRKLSSVWASRQIVMTNCLGLHICRWFRAIRRSWVIESSGTCTLCANSYRTIIGRAK